MDFLTLIKPENLTSFAENYNYKLNGYMGQKLFPAQKTRNLKVDYKKLVEYGDLPVMAQVHALDSEARIGDRTNFQEFELQKLLIKEKLNQGESVAYYLDSLNGSEAGIVEYIFNDAANLLSRVITRTEVANMELLCTGGMTISENNVSTTLNFGFKDDNKIILSGWSDASHDIIGDLTAIQKKAKSKGWTVVRAITSSKITGYLFKNTAIKAFWSNSMSPITESAVISWVLANFSIEIVVNDDVYKLSATSNTQKRFYDEDSITFLGTRSALGAGLFGVTPEELKLKQTSKSEKMLCTLTMWESEDPATTWTKASGMYLPVIKNIDKMIIAKVN